MTRSKTELATILVKLRGDVTDPKEVEKETARLANELSLMKLCYEIQKVEEEREAAPATEEAQTREAIEDEAVPLTAAEEAIVEELKAPEKSTPKQKHKHILSWLLDSSSDEDES